MYQGGGGESCAVFRCTNNRKKLYTWKQSICQEHKSIFHKDCPCVVPFSLHKIPKEENERLKWQRALHRNDLPKNVFVCSTHFIDGRPTARNPTPTLNLGQCKMPLHHCRTGVCRKIPVHRITEIPGCYLNKITYKMCEIGLNNLKYGYFQLDIYSNSCQTVCCMVMYGYE